MPTDLTHFSPVHYVTHMSFETRLATRHGRKDGLYTAAHDHVVFGVGGGAEEGADGNGVHGELLLEVAQDFEGFWVEYLRAIIRSSTQHTKVFAKGNCVDLSPFMHQRLGHQPALIIIPANIPIIRANEHTLIINIPQRLAGNLLRFGVLGVDDSLKLEIGL